MKIKLNNWILIVIISCTLSLFFLSPIIATVSNTPKDHQNFMVGLYFEDYFEYLSFIRQGQEGNILMINRFTNSSEPKLFSPWWPYSLMGFITYLFHLNIPPQYIFWAAVGIFSFFYFLLTFAVVKGEAQNESLLIKILLFLMIVTASGFFTIQKTNGWQVTPFNFWYSIGSPFARYNIGTPHHQLMNLIFLLGIILVMRMNRLKPIYFTSGFLLVSVILLFISPPQLALFWLSYLVTSLVYALWKKKKSFKMLVVLVIVLIVITPLIFFMNAYSHKSPVFVSGRLWDIRHTFYPSLTLFIQTSGIILAVALAGMSFYLVKITPSRLMLFFVTVFSFLIVLVPIPSSSNNILVKLGIHNLRFATPVSYVFLGLSVLSFFRKIFRKKLLVTVAILTVIFISLPSLYSFWQIQLKVPYQASFLQYMPNSLYFGLNYLSDKGGDRAILTSPASSLGVVIPAITGKRVYLGRSIFTPDIDQRIEKSKDFYNLTIDKSKAEDFLKKENIGFIIASKMDSNKEKLNEHYNFLSKIFENSELTIYSVNL